MNNKIQIGIVDDHLLFSNALAKLINGNSNFEVSLTAIGGNDLQSKIKSSKIVPKIILMDVNIQDSNGIEQTKWLKENYPQVKVIALSMDGNQVTIVKMIKAGSCGYLLKDMAPEQFINALNIVHEKGFFHSELVGETLLEKMGQDDIVSLNDKEMKFLEYVCSDKTYKEIAAEMYLSPKTIDKYRESLFQKFSVKSRTALALFSIKMGYVDINGVV